MAPSQAVEQSVGLRLVLTSGAAVVSEAATFPIDITKTRLQLQGEGGHGGVRRGAFGMAMNIVKEEGMVGLYRGLSPAVLRHTFYTSIRIVTYEQLRDNLHKGDNQHDISAGKKALIGGASGMFGQLIASPADLVKVRMQLDGRLIRLGQTPRYTGVVDALSKIVKTEGVTGLWRGVGPSVQRAFLVNMGELACYDGAKQWVITRGMAGDNIYSHTLASIMSGLTATILSCPADVVKTRMMNQAAGEKLYRNSLDCLAKTVKAEGITALWKGFFPTWARLGPWQFVFWVSYEQMRKASGLSSF
jgi:solute carrier family 25 uncoupling protein 27